MRKYFSIPLLFLILSGALGLFLRWHLHAPVRDVTYGNWLHAHSHTMFLGWLFNFFNLVYLYYAFGAEWKKGYKGLFLVNQILVTGMLVFFPLQGYGSVTIPLSLSHTVVSGIFCFRFFRDTAARRSEPGMWFACLSLVFFLISSIGAFALGPLKASGLGGTQWYYFTIYFYLHFQYNGFFQVGILSLLLMLLKERNTTVDAKSIKTPGLMLVISIVLTYALSVLWADSPPVWNWIGFVGAALQLVAVSMVIRGIQASRENVLRKFLPSSLWLLRVILVALYLKLLLQLISAHPDIARLAYENRHFVIAYLHLMLIGVVTFFVLGWYIESGFLRRVSPLMVAFLVYAFIFSELIMIAIPFIPLVAAYGPLLLFSVSVVLFLALGAVIKC